MVATKKTIFATMPVFVTKEIKTENKHLWRSTVNLINNLKLQQSLYLKEHNLMLIALMMRFSEQTCIEGKKFNNFLLVKQIQMIHAILGKEKTRLYTMIKAILKQINTIS